MTAAVSGALVMIIEVVGSRVIGPFFGVSLFVWTSLITVALVALAAGYAVGGVLSDRRPSPAYLYGTILAAGILTLLIPVLKGSVLKATVSWGLRSGAFASSLALFGPALFLLGCVSPYVVRIAAKEMQNIGRTVGVFYAISTVGSFLGTVVTGFVLIAFDREHLDYYRDLDHIKEVFADYLAKLPQDALVVAWADDPYLAPLLKKFPHRLLTYSLNGAADFGADRLETKGLGCSFRLSHRGRELSEIKLPLAGAHYVLNSLAACSVAHSLGLPFSAWQRGLSSLGQIHRRCQVKGEAQGILIIDDYGHHPAEIAATLTALAQAFPERRLAVAFQPHRFSRTQALLHGGYLGGRR